MSARRSGGRTSAVGARSGWVAGGAALVLFFAAGCSSVPKRVPATAEKTPVAPKPAVPKPPGLTVPAPETKPTPPPVAKAVPPPREDESVPAGMVRVRIESEPAGALIVVGDRVVGHAPLTVNLAVTSQGFFSDPVLIRARFLASDAQQESVSVKEACEPVDRVPRVIVFTPQGATRVAR